MKQVIVVETGETFESICEAARKLNVHKSYVSSACHRDNGTVNGLHLQFVNA